MSKDKNEQETKFAAEEYLETVSGVVGKTGLDCAPDIFHGENNNKNDQGLTGLQSDIGEIREVFSGGIGEMVAGELASS